MLPIIQPCSGQVGSHLCPLWLGYPFFAKNASRVVYRPGFAVLQSSFLQCPVNGLLHISILLGSQEWGTWS